MSPEVEGDVRFAGLPESLGEGIPGFVDTPVKATLDLPAQAAIGAAWDVAEGWEMEFDISWAGWSSFEALAIDVANETAVVFDQMLVENWDDTMCFRLGAAWDMAEQHQLRFGLLYDQSPVPKDTLRPSIPDADRWAPTFGYGYKGEKWDIDAYYMPLFFKDITAVGDPANKPGMTLLPDGVIDGKYSSFVHLLGVTFNVRF